jgi:hypothetical protein
MREAGRIFPAAEEIKFLDTLVDLGEVGGLLATEPHGNSKKAGNEKVVFNA